MPNYKNYAITTNSAGRPPLLSRLIKAHLKGEDADLSPDDEKILQRWKVVQMLSIQHRPCISNSEIKRVLIKDFGISEGMAMKDISNAQQLFGHVNSVNKQFKRAVYIEWLEQLASLAEAKGDFKSAVSAIERAAELAQLNNNEDELNNSGTKVFQLNMFFGGADGELSRKTIDMDKIDEIPETEFKEIIKAIDRPRVNIETMAAMLEKHHDNNQ